MRKVVPIILLTLAGASAIVNVMFLATKIKWLIEAGFLNHSGWAQELVKPIAMLWGSLILILPLNLDRPVPNKTRRILLTLALISSIIGYTYLHIQGGVKSNVLMLLELVLLEYFCLMRLPTLRLILASPLFIVCAHQIYETYLAIIRPILEKIPIWAKLSQPLSYTTLFAICATSIERPVLFSVAMFFLAFSNIHLTLHSLQGLVLLPHPFDIVIGVCERLGAPLLYMSMGWGHRVLDQVFREKRQ